MPSKNCDFCNFFKNYEKLEKSQLLLKLTTPSVEGSHAKTAISTISAISPKIAKKLEKSQFLLKLTKSSVRGGRRMPSKNCNFCDFCDFSKNYEKLEKSQFLLK